MSRTADIIERWLATQPDSVCERFIDNVSGLQGAERAEFNRAAGIKAESRRGLPYRDEFGRLIIHNITPTELRRLRAEQAARR